MVDAGGRARTAPPAWLRHRRDVQSDVVLGLALAPTRARVRSAAAGEARHDPSRRGGRPTSRPRATGGVTGLRRTRGRHDPGTWRCPAGRTGRPRRWGRTWAASCAGDDSPGVRLTLPGASRRADRGKEIDDGRERRGRPLVGRPQVGPVASGSPCPCCGQRGGPRSRPAGGCGGRPERVAVGHSVTSRRKVPSSSLGPPGAQPDDAVAQVGRPALRRHVAEADEEVGVLERRAQVQRGRERSDDGQVLVSTGLV